MIFDPERGRGSAEVAKIWEHWRAISGAFEKLRKATIRFVMSLSLSIRMEQLGSHLRDFHEI
jgi:hypothetical protein